MQLTPTQAFEHIKESVIEYLETAYRISHGSVYAERAELLRQRGTVAQAPFIEATPAFPTSRKLAALEREFPDKVPTGLSELVQHGVPVDRFDLYTHQEEALLAAYSDNPHLLVATGTGSGKTEAFLLPILADLLKETCSWPAPISRYARGEYNAQTDVWLPSRRHESRPAAIHGIVLYPMNALVNDQLSRLRRILARGDSPDWQRRNLNGNVIHFGMYTSLTRVTGSYREKSRRDRLAEYLQSVEDDWAKLPPELCDTGFWPRPDSPEMLCRWDIQAAPPDILVTNYSMLEYMLVRPIENSIFTKTREWLTADPEARLTLVVDEAHTYTGAKGTEVAHLIRRLKERLGIAEGSPQFRAIATTASVPADQDNRLREFISDLFGEPQESFTLIRLGQQQKKGSARKATKQAFDAFSKFHQTFNLQESLPAIKQLAVDLDLGDVDTTQDSQVALHSVLADNLDVAWVRERTARNATLLDQLAQELWPNLGTKEARERATAGVLAAGSYARPSGLADTPPLLSMRLHGFFRGISGIWACMNPNCPELDPKFIDPKHPRPVGKLYLDPRPWCGPKCGSRVLELFSCRHCGLLFLGGIPDDAEHSLWPWSDDLNGDRQDLKLYRIFGVEQPHREARPEYRSSRTTLGIHQNDSFARPTYEIEEATERNGAPLSPFPIQCPRCQNYRAPGPDGREVIEPLRTKGAQSFSVVIEDAFRVQPRAARGEPPNFGRKALLFTDSRNEAAQLAADTRRNHYDDLLRQFLFQIVYRCRACHGSGRLETSGPFRIGEAPQALVSPCPACSGTGRNAAPGPIEFRELRNEAIEFYIRQGINPTRSRIVEFFAQFETDHAKAQSEAEMGLNLNLRRELAEDEFAMEPLGLARWRVPLPGDFGRFEDLTEEETRSLIQATARILSTENVLLPPEPYKPWEWPPKSLKTYEQSVLLWANGTPKGTNNIKPYNLSHYRKIGRYVRAVARALVAARRITYADPWVDALRKPLWDTLIGLKILQPAGARLTEGVPYGIRIDCFQLEPIGDTIHQCTACAYVMSYPLLGVCWRCGQTTEPRPASDLQNYYRRAAFYALPGSGLDDPFPLNAHEHTAQIARGDARNLERWFQDLFHGDQKPFDYRVDLLSVTTTMEMGIDIGSLLTVGLRNVPPTVANYQQRAGRAGRRGSALATVLTFSQFRSHDQYYFDRPPEIVSQSPRVPALYFANEVIARRHVRSLVLQDFFYRVRGPNAKQALFEAWGTGREFKINQHFARLTKYVATSRGPLVERCKHIVHSSFHTKVGVWIDQLPEEVHDQVIRHEPDESILTTLINAGLLPKYAFPVDVVSLWIPSFNQHTWDYESDEPDPLQRDLKIAIAEYAPGAEVIRGEHPKTYIYKSAGLYNPFERTPDYHPTGVLVECGDCLSVELLNPNTTFPDLCSECHSANLNPLPYIRPSGFTVDGAQSYAAREEYDGGGRERSGSATPARLLVGKNAFLAGTAQTPFAPNLYAYVREGELFTCNKGPNRNFPGYLICPLCGRALEEACKHKYPADIPPRVGPQRGPRAGNWCPNQNEVVNAILGHRFNSEVILLGVDLPSTLDAPFGTPAGKAVWYSFGTLIANAASIVLQLDPGELKVGVRAVLRGPDRVHGEVYLYDDVPGGAGYARAIGRHLEEILGKALELGSQCQNPTCVGACYHCMFDYRNQTLHPLLDRPLGVAVLEYILQGKLPSLSSQQVSEAVTALDEYVHGKYQLEPGRYVLGYELARVFSNKVERIGLWVIHPLQARPSPTERQKVTAVSGFRCAVHTSFDLIRRPFWVMNNLIQP